MNNVNFMVVLVADTNTNLLGGRSSDPRMICDVYTFVSDNAPGRTIAAHQNYARAIDVYHTLLIMFQNKVAHQNRF